ncbi:MAG: molybdopterin biosynthesis protein MoeB [Alphaproteobacteria bacterium]|jgi:molybdopterin/thiamine biosynthesis adenylyltransferase|nr:molybdopterin biosynthesis protein MoeB [Alphaproteobacteria bacterium]
MALSPDLLDRHRRHIMLKEIGGPGLARLRDAHVTLVGAGALGGPCALYLAAAGCGHITLYDDDRVERSNLQRQVQFTEADIGAGKATRLRDRLLALDPSLDIVARPRRFTQGLDLEGDILIDATDNFETRFALNEHAHKTARKLVSGAATGWSGQVGIFASGCIEGAPCYRCFVPQTPLLEEDCAGFGVVGAVTGMVGSRMALEALKLITGAGEALIGRLWLFDGLSGEGRVVRLRQDPDCPVCGR